MFGSSPLLMDPGLGEVSLIGSSLGNWEEVVAMIERLPPHEIRALNLHCNDLSSIDESAIASLSALIELNLSSNRFSTVDLPSLMSLPCLLRLDLSGNFISSIEQMPFLPNLEHLYLAHNQIHNLNGIENLPSLIVLDIRANQIESPVDLMSIAYLESVQSLHLSNADGSMGNPICQSLQCLIDVFEMAPSLQFVNDQSQEDWKAKLHVPIHTPKLDSVLKKYKQASRKADPVLHLRDVSSQCPSPDVLAEVRSNPSPKAASEDQSQTGPMVLLALAIRGVFKSYRVRVLARYFNMLRTMRLNYIQQEVQKALVDKIDLIVENHRSEVLSLRELNASAMEDALKRSEEDLQLGTAKALAQHNADIAQQQRRLFYEKQRCAALTRRNAALEKQVSSAESKISEIKSACVNKDSEICHLRQLIDDSSEQLASFASTASSEKAMLNDKIYTMSKTIEEQSQTIMMSEQGRTLLCSKVEVLEKEVDEKKAQIVEMSATIHALTAALEENTIKSDEMSKEMDRMRTAMNSIAKENDNSMKEIITLRDTLKTNMSDVDHFKKVVGKLQTKKAEMSAKHKDLSDSLRKAVTQLEAEKLRASNLCSVTEKLKVLVTDYKYEKNIMQRKIKAMEASINLRNGSNSSVGVQVSFDDNNFHKQDEMAALLVDQRVIIENHEAREAELVQEISEISMVIKIKDTMLEDQVQATQEVEQRCIELEQALQELRQRNRAYTEEIDYLHDVMEDLEAQLMSCRAVEDEAKKLLHLVA